MEMVSSQDMGSSYQVSITFAFECHKRELAAHPSDTTKHIAKHDKMYRAGPERPFNYQEGVYGQYDYSQTKAYIAWCAISGSWIWEPSKSSEHTIKRILALPNSIATTITRKGESVGRAKSNESPRKTNEQKL
jgi:hypothetical protein